MHLRELLNVAYARLLLGREPEEVEKLDALLERPDPIPGRARRKAKGAASGTALLMAAARMPQQGAAVRPRRPKGVTT